MRKKVIIRNITGLTLLCLFILSITPQRLLHDLFSTHVDEQQHHEPSQVDVGKDGYSCDVDHLVVTCPFNVEPAMPALLSPLEFNIYIPLFADRVVTADTIYCELRGPPAGV